MQGEIAQLHATARNDMKIDHILESLVKDDERAGAADELALDNEAYNKMNLKIWKEGKELGDLRTAKHQLEKDSDIEYELWKDSIVEQEMEQSRLL